MPLVYSAVYFCGMTYVWQVKVFWSLPCQKWALSIQNSTFSREFKKHNCCILSWILVAKMFKYIFFESSAWNILIKCAATSACFAGVPTAFALARLTDTGGRKIVSSKGKPHERGEFWLFWYNPSKTLVNCPMVFFVMAIILKFVLLQMYHCFLILKQDAEKHFCVSCSVLVAFCCRYSNGRSWIVYYHNTLLLPEGQDYISHDSPLQIHPCWEIFIRHWRNHYRCWEWRCFTQHQEADSMDERIHWGLGKNDRGI